MLRWKHVIRCDKYELKHQLKHQLKHAYLLVTGHLYSFIIVKNASPSVIATQQEKRLLQHFSTVQALLRCRNQTKHSSCVPSCNLCTSWAKYLLVHTDAGEDTILLGVLWETIQELADVIFRVHPNTLGAADPTEHTTALAFGQKSHGVLRIAFLLLDVHLQCGAMNKVEMLQLGFALPVPSLNNLRSCHCIRKGVVGDQIVELLALFCFHLVHERANP